MKLKTDDLKIVLIGNPNTGKTTLFNGLCGTRQKIGNYPGVTVEKKEGIFKTNKINATIFDLPGLYSLRISSDDEKIAFEVLTGKFNKEKKPDLIFYIIDASNIKRNLYLLLQILGLEIPVVGIITMMDVLEKKGYELDVPKLQKKLKIPLFSVNAKKMQDIEKLKSDLENLLLNYQDIHKPEFEFPENYQSAIAYFHKNISNFLEKNQVDFQCTKSDTLLCLTNSRDFLELVKNYASMDNGILDDLKNYINLIYKDLKQFQIFSPSQIISMRYKLIDEILHDILIYKGSRKNISEKIDNVLTHRFWGFLIFVAIMAFMFIALYSWSTPLMGFIESFFSLAGNSLEEIESLPPIIKSFLIDGIISGIGSVIVFVPQIAILFLFIALLEDSGYLARAAFLMDKIFSWCGLNGRSFIPLISGFACSVPSIMSTRVITDPSVKKTTIFVIPLISCSARLPIYILFIGTFIEPRYGPIIAGITLFGMHSLGAILAFFVSLIINKRIYKFSNIPFIMELPEYHIPTIRNIYFRVYEAVKSFLTRAGTIIFIMSIIIWFLSYFPRDEEKAHQYGELVKHEILIQNEDSLSESDLEELLEKYKNSYYLENSFLGRTGKLIEPIFRPLGFDWKLSVGIVSAFPARETIISTLGILYNVGSEATEDSENLRTKIKNEKKADGSPLYNLLNSLSLMVFFSLSAQCMSTLAIIKKELNSWKYPIYVFIYMTLLAYFLALVIYQTGSFLIKIL